MGTTQSLPDKNIGLALASVPVASAHEFFNDPDLNFEDPDLPEDLEANTELEKNIDVQKQV